MTTTDTPSRAEIERMAYNYGVEAAHHFWQIDPAEYDMAVEWVRNAEAGTLHDNYDIPGPFDEIPNDLNTEGWSWSDLADYGAAWEQGYLDETTALCRQVIAADDMAAANEVRHER
jgi:hypothetical protein